MKVNLRDLSFSELDSLVASLGEPAFRSKQIRDWVHSKNAVSVESMTNLSKQLREKLSATHCADGLATLKKTVSRDGTIKYLFGLKDGLSVETVYIPEEGRKTVCVSSQVGCKFSCAFCATGGMGFSRNLTQGEILGQVTEVRRDKSAGDPTNVVFMGMGEPLDNLGAVIPAVAILNSPDGFNIGGRRITVSTVGLPEQINKLASAGLNMNLAVSLHSADDKIRSSLLPINKKYPVATLAAACANYPLKHGRKITFEVILFDGVNDSAEDSAKMIKALHRVKSKKVNLIRFNPVSNPALKPSPPGKVNAFKTSLENAGIDCTIRISKGEDISAACGQLKADFSKKSAE
ncbi:MAG: 23S rRNA (adenine(2503)-C(2))-methyltransferase RlmN [Nitrospinae bacterium]|nr:23S rRNA (adenine(2503)-C(2))-methyltransferase RlmN [Nitrospinota bacterium]